ncbi:hypothetical protein B0T19DRAFT_288628 [Cercophora scortea]|uniref:Uncharacterized protein n=1 Tax=Cercophora scortea TaxID=314031 RepID=A0AAE0I456_9PEZI|nr:hypothetical protein B0T19DRAFT_288628 [Cercophora scortea]
MVTRMPPPSSIDLPKQRHARLGISQRATINKPLGAKGWQEAALTWILRRVCISYLPIYLSAVQRGCHNGKWPIKRPRDKNAKDCRSSGGIYLAQPLALRRDQSHSRARGEGRKWRHVAPTGPPGAHVDLHRVYLKIPNTKRGPRWPVRFLRSTLDDTAGCARNRQALRPFIVAAWPSCLGFLCFSPEVFGLSFGQLRM